jgi:hypothetical protein
MTIRSEAIAGNPLRQLALSPRFVSKQPTRASGYDKLTGKTI